MAQGDSRSDSGSGNETSHKGDKKDDDSYEYYDSDTNDEEAEPPPKTNKVTGKMNPADSPNSNRSKTKSDEKNGENSNENTKQNQSQSKNSHAPKAQTKQSKEKNAPSSDYEYEEEEEEEVKEKTNEKTQNKRAELNTNALNKLLPDEKAIQKNSKSENNQEEAKKEPEKKKEETTTKVAPKKLPPLKNKQKKQSSSSSEYEYEEEEEEKDEKNEKEEKEEVKKEKANKNITPENLQQHPKQAQKKTPQPEKKSSSSEYEYEEEEEEEEEGKEGKVEKTTNQNKTQPNKKDIDQKSAKEKLKNSKNNKSSSSSEYEYEEEEEEEEEEGEIKEGETSSVSKKIPPHLIKENKIEDNANNNAAPANPNSSPEEGAMNGLDEEVMITAVATPKTGESARSHIENDTYRSAQQESQYTSTFTEEELEKELDKYLKTKKLPPKEARQDVAVVARQRAMELMINEEYDKAYETKLALERLSANLKGDEKAYDEAEIKHELEGKYENAANQQKNIAKKYKEKFEELNIQQQESRESLKQRHDADMEMFAEKWRQPETLVPFQKPSTRLLQLRRMQKSQAISMNFVQAKQLKITADKLQKEETNTARIKATEAMKIEYQSIVERQKKELALWNELWERKRTNLEAEKMMEESANNNLMKQLSNRIKGPKIPKKQAVTFPISVTSRAPGSSLGLFSAKTRNLVNEYRSKPDVARLDLRPAEIKAIVRPKLSPRKLASTMS